MLGRSRLMSGVVGVVSRVATRWGPSPTPKRFVLAVTAGEVHLLPMTKAGMGHEAAAWSRPALRVLAEPTKRGVELLIHTPGDGPGIECLGPDEPDTHRVVAALTRP